MLGNCDNILPTCTTHLDLTFATFWSALFRKMPDYYRGFFVANNLSFRRLLLRASRKRESKDRERNILRKNTKIPKPKLAKR